MDLETSVHSVGALCWARGCEKTGYNGQLQLSIMSAAKLIALLKGFHVELTDYYCLWQYILADKVRR